MICVSHTEGAGGQEIARLLAERVEFRYVDDGIILDAARAEKLFPEAVSQAESRGAGRKLERVGEWVVSRTASRDLCLAMALLGHGQKAPIQGLVLAIVLAQC